MPAVVVSDLARDDLIDIWLYIADDSENAADRLMLSGYRDLEVLL
jgi:plasmid stabilization system protein ParE